jgi:hypothetical protein
MTLRGATTTALIGAVAVIAGAPIGTRAEQPKTKIDFVSNGIGVPPTDFEFWRTGHGDVGQWTVVRDATAVAGASIEQFSLDNTEDRFPVAIYKPISAKNVEVSTHFKLVGGTMQSAGVAVRVTSASEYYAVRVSALEARVDLFLVMDGKIKRIAGADAHVVRNRWQTLGVIAENDRFTISLDDRLVFTAWDRTFLGDGHIALWTEDDNITRFEEIVITPLPWSRED